MRLEPLWLALLLPFFLFPTPGSILVLLGLPALWIIRRVARGRFSPATPFDWAICLLLLSVLVSLYATYDLRVSLDKITLLLFSVAALYAIVEWTSHRQTTRTPG